MHAYGNINIYTYSIKRGLIQDTSFLGGSDLKFSFCFQSHSNYSMAFCSSQAILNWWLEYLHVSIFSLMYFHYFLPVIFSGYQQKTKITTDSLPANTPSPTLASYKQHEWCGTHNFYCIREPLRAVSFPIKT